MCFKYVSELYGFGSGGVGGEKNGQRSRWSLLALDLTSEMPSVYFFHWRVVSVHMTANLKEHDNDLTPQNTNLQEVTKDPFFLLNIFLAPVAVTPAHLHTSTNLCSIRELRTARAWDEAVPEVMHTNIYISGWWREPFLGNVIVLCFLSAISIFRIIPASLLYWETIFSLCLYHGNLGYGNFVPVLPSPCKSTILNSSVRINQNVSGT